jgi:predicted transcriptional regulator
MQDLKTVLKQRYGPTGRDIILDGADVVSQRGYTLLPNFILYRPGLSAYAKLIYAMILSYAWGTKRAAFPGQQRLAADCGMGVATVKRYIKELVDKGAMTVVRRGQGRTNIYVLHFKKR